MSAGRERRGEVGELAIRGPKVMRDMQRADRARCGPEASSIPATAACWTRGLRPPIVDSKKDMIWSRFKSVPNEIGRFRAITRGVLECRGDRRRRRPHSAEVTKVFVVKRGSEPHRAGRPRALKKELNGTSGRSTSSPHRSCRRTKTWQAPARALRDEKNGRLNPTSCSEELAGPGSLSCGLTPLVLGRQAHAALHRRVRGSAPSRRIGVCLFILLLAAVEGRAALRFDGASAGERRLGVIASAGPQSVRMDRARITAPRNTPRSSSRLQRAHRVTVWLLGGQRPAPSRSDCVAAAIAGGFLMCHQGRSARRVLTAGDLLGDLIVFCGARALLGSVYVLGGAVQGGRRLAFTVLTCIPGAVGLLLANIGCGLLAGRRCLARQIGSIGWQLSSIVSLGHRGFGRARVQ